MVAFQDLVDSRREFIFPVEAPFVRRVVSRSRRARTEQVRFNEVISSKGEYGILREELSGEKERERERE